MALRNHKICLVIVAIAVNIVWLSMWDTQSKQVLERNLKVAKLLEANPCYVKLEAHLQPLQRKWYTSRAPILHDLVVVGDDYYAIFNIDGTMANGEAGRYKDYNDYHSHEWWCDGERGAVVSRDESNHTIIVKCHDVKHEIVASPVVFGESYDKQQIVYNVEANMECVQNDPILFPPSTKYASCTAIRGGGNRELLPQWIEHHRLIGVEHFFVYVNEPLHEMDNLYPQPYVTYIPFDYEPKNPYYFQATWQNDCIYRAKNASVTWVGIHDIDEYFEPMEEPYQIANVMDHYNPDKDVGISVLNHWWGPHPDEPWTHEKAEILMDYVWRAPSHFGPQKNIVSPKLVDYYYVHWVRGMKPEAHPLHIGQHVLRQIRMNHFRRPYTHVHDVEFPETLVKDTSFRDRYSDRVKAAIADGRSRNIVSATA